MYLTMRPLMPPFAFCSSKAMRMAFVLFTPHSTVTPDRSVLVPMTISFSLTPPANAGVATAAAATAVSNNFRIRTSPFAVLFWHEATLGTLRRSGLSGHLFDQFTILLADEPAAQFHHRREFRIFRLEPLFDEAEGTYRFREHTVHPGNFGFDQAAHGIAAHEPRETGKRDPLRLGPALDVFMVDHDQRSEPA